jgi:hypothetical protein
MIPAFVGKVRRRRNWVRGEQISLQPSEEESGEVVEIAGRWKMEGAPHPLHEKECAND